VAVVLTIVQAKQIIINIHKQTIQKTQYKIYPNEIVTIYTNINIARPPTLAG
jgi:hypothetical protein